MFWAGQSDERRICLLGLEGSLSSNHLVNLTERLRGLAVQGVLRVVVDLRRVTHWDYRGLQCLAEAVEYRNRLGGVTAFVSPSRYLRDIAAAAGVLDHLDFYDELHMGTVAEPIPHPREAIPVGDAELRRASGQGP